MYRILLLVENNENRRLLAEYLGATYQILRPGGGDMREALGMPFDICIIDAQTLDKLWEHVRARRAEEGPVFLPFIALVSRSDISIATRRLHETVDETITIPIEKVELQARLGTSLRARKYSVDLKLRNDELDAFINAMTHDLRAPMRIINGFVKVLFEDQVGNLNEDSKHYLNRIQEASESASELIDELLGFVRLGRKELVLTATELQPVIDAVLLDVRDEIKTREAEVLVEGELPIVQGNFALLRVALTNLLTNAMNFVAPKTRPRVIISASADKGVCTIEVRDNGIGIAEPDQERVFKPFVRLHGVEDYTGTGLGLATVQKAVDLMGGRAGVKSTPGEGSTFWIRLNCSEAV